MANVVVAAHGTKHKKRKTHYQRCQAYEAGKRRERNKLRRILRYSHKDAQVYAKQYGLSLV